MKNAKYLLLLIPSLFLITSCQTTPHVDTITEQEAKDFINTNYKDVVAKAPDASSLAKWKITKDNDIGDAKKQISYYIGNSVEENEKNDVSINSDRLSQYTNELTKEAMGDIGHDAVIAMSPKIYEELYQSSQNEPGKYSLIYKNGPNNGLIVISQLQSTTSVHTRYHTYNAQGQETEFKVEFYKDNLEYTMTINFKYV